MRLRGLWQKRSVAERAMFRARGTGCVLQVLLSAELWDDAQEMNGALKYTVR